MMQPLSGQSFIGFARSQSTGPSQRCVNPATATELPTAFFQASSADVEQACSLALAAAPVLAALVGTQKAAFLRAIVSRIEAATPDLVARATQETALPEARCQGEIGRTMSQLRLFADLVETGDWLDARIETANPDRKPLPKPDHRSMLRPLGPVAVFCASNFPFAYSVAGGDTASAFAAGCPVIVMAHHAHTGTAEIMGGLVADAVRASGLPEGTFSMLMGSGRVIGQQLAKHPAIRAIGFTGSRAGGRSLMDTAAARPVPIPVYAEMSSVNPVVLLEGAIASRADAIAMGLVGSCTLGVGQFCTQPGIVVLERTAAAKAFVERFSQLFTEAAEGTMLTAGIHQAYTQGIAARTGRVGVTVLARGPSSGQPNRATPTLFAADAKAFVADAGLQEEIFGPSSLIVWCENAREREQVVAALHGSLTATIHATDAELAANTALIAQLEAIAGRVVVNGFPTGVEVSHAIVHGGPYPSLSDGRTTSVGSNAIYRFTRLVCYQNFPDAALPAELQGANPLGISRLVNGVRQSGSV
jgi:alpha-ketoglutaric semialdehyde dehydrogenase